MVKAGAPVDQTIDTLIPLLEPGDILIDGGNSNFNDTRRRTKKVEEAGLLYIGTGVSGGEEGARYGPSIMPGGSAEAWPHVKDVFQAIAAKTEDGEPCCDWVGDDGAGHFVKMVHNGIEYGDMQVIAEAYDVMKTGLGLNNDAMHRVFDDWNKGKLESYLIEITRDILGFKDDEGDFVIDKILDTAGQKGTGKWTAIESLDKGIPLTLVSEAVFARFLSALLEDRKDAAKHLTGFGGDIKGDQEAVLRDLESAVYGAKIVSYAQGYMLMQAAAKEYDWSLNLGGIALMWRGGCIIRSVFLGHIKEAYTDNPNLSNLLLAPYFKEAITAALPGWRRIVSAAAMAGIPVPALSSALSFFDGYRRERTPANMIQAQRDYFGAHTYERVDKPRGEFFHTDWIGSGAAATAGSYQA
jgi:6-phosphogluconate dehydrogenase